MLSNRPSNIRPSGFGRSRIRQSGFLLLEVVVAVGLLVLGMAVIGTQLQSATDRSIQTDQLARVVFLAESKLTEMSTGLVKFELEQEGDFGRLFPFYGWRIVALPLPEDPNPTTPRQPLDTPMVAITLEVLLDSGRDYQTDEEFDFEEAVVVSTYHTLRSLPRPINLAADFGLDADRAEEINLQLADVGGGLIDVNELNPAMFRDMSMEELLEVLPVLMPALGVGAESMLNMVPAELRPVVEAMIAAQAAGGDGSSGDGSGDGSGSDGGTDQGSSADTGTDTEGSQNTGDDRSGGDAQPSADDEADSQNAPTDGSATADPSTNDPENDDPEDDQRGGGRRG
ncbi:MAG: hypothetical protein GXP29_08245, partial [Planctomycetes bacterium]|nr:hypothetical protein [Planctomycetota bacterium]